MPPHARTIASSLREFTQMNPPMFFGSKLDEYPQEFFDEVYKILFAMGVNLRRSPSWCPINSKVWPKLGTHNGGIIGC